MTRTEKPAGCCRPRELLMIVGVFGLVGFIIYLVWLINYRYESDEYVVERFQQRFYANFNTWRDNHWLGVPTWQNPNDLWITQEILTEVKPDVMIETGTYKGGSALIWAMILNQINPDARVITIDIEDHSADFPKSPLFRDKVDFLLGSSTAPEIVAEVKKRVAGKKVLVLLDSDHRKPHVLEELRLYSPLVSPGSYLIVQDSNLNGHPVYALAAHQQGPGPMEALEEFLAGNDQFVPDRKRERLLLTFCPKGFLKRVK